jgi:hypothetical protein
MQISRRQIPPFVTLTGTILWVAGCSAERATAPTSYTPYEAADKAFSCSAPGGWQSQSSAGQGIRSGATFRKGGALIDIDADLQGSLMGDIARSAGNVGAGLIPGLEAKRKPPVETVHEMKQRDVARSMPQYREGPAKPWRSSAGDARVSEFVAGGGMFAEKVHGYRVTILAAERSIEIICKCPEADWPTLQPVFVKVMTSIKGG